MSEAHAIDAEVRLYDTLFSKADPTGESDGDSHGESDGETDGQDLAAHLNPNSLEILTGCKVEPSLASAAPGSTYQFLRQGYFCVDSVDSAPGKLVFNRTVPLRDSWARTEKFRG